MPQITKPEDRTENPRHCDRLTGGLRLPDPQTLAFDRCDLFLGRIDQMTKNKGSDLAIFGKIRNP